MSECRAAENSQASSPITLKGTSNGFEIFIESTAKVADIVREIEGKLEEAPGFFKGGDVTLHFDDDPPRGYLGPIEEVTDRFQLRIVSVHGPAMDVDEVMSELGLVEPVLAAGSEAVDSVDSNASLPDAPLAPKMIVGPVRSGCILEVTGHLIVIGDVNPGAEIRAEGSIVVLGRLRGIAHAGSSAFILALQMEPQQLRVGTLVARAGDAEQAPDKAEIAYAKNGSIVVDNYKGRVPTGIATAKF